MTSVRTKCQQRTGQHGAQRFTESPGITVPVPRRSAHYSPGPIQYFETVGATSLKRMAKLRTSANILPEECSASEGVNVSATVCESTLPRRWLCPVGLCATGQTCPALARCDEVEESDSAVHRRQATLAQASGTLLRRVAPCEAFGPSPSGAVVLWDVPPQSRRARFRQALKRGSEGGASRSTTYATAANGRTNRLLLLARCAQLHGRRSFWPSPPPAVGAYLQHFMYARS